MKNITKAVASALLVALSSQSMAANNKLRWFEVEVLLFRQLGDKTLIKEQFNEQVTATAITKTKNHRILDLLKPYLQPDLSGIKQQLPFCDADQQTRHQFYQAYWQQVQLPELMPLKTLDDIEQQVELSPQLQALLATDIYVPAETATPDSSVNSTELLQQPIAGTDNNEFINPVTTDIIDDQQQTADNTSTIDDELTPLTTEQLAVLAQADDWYQQQVFSYTPKPFPHFICQLPEQVIAQLKQTDSEYNPDYFPLDSVPSRINQAEDLTTSKPYLIGKQYFELNDIELALKRSSEFKPLTHLAYRIAPTAKTRSRAIPLALYAGDNLELAYQQAMQSYQQQVERAQAELQVTQQQNAINSESLAINDLTEQAQLIDTQAEKPLVAQKLEQIIAQLGTADDALYNQQPTANVAQKLILLEPEQNQHQAEALPAIAKPIAPPQPWELQGWLKIHLDHYLFITADFTVTDKTLAEQQSDWLKQQALIANNQVQTDNQTGEQPQNQPITKLIRFEQNRRVISKEIHYFDHPYIGMIVQIRRYQKPKPTPEAEQE